MNTPNPLVPQGTFPDNRGRSHIRLAVFAILAVHIVLLGGLLMLGCRKPAGDDQADRTPTNPYPPVVLPPEPTIPPVVVSTTPPPVVVPIPPPVVPPIAPPVQPDIVPAGPGTEHVVVKGDSFYTLGKKYGVTIKAITEANPGVDSSKLKIGQKLTIPASKGSTSGTPAHATSNGGSSAPAGSEKTYVVKSGDNLLKIAKANGIGVKALRSANSLKTDQIKVGQKLKIPGKAAPVATAPEPGAAPVAPPPPTSTTLPPPPATPNP